MWLGGPKILFELVLVLKDSQCICIVMYFDNDARGFYPLQHIIEMGANK